MKRLSLLIVFLMALSACGEPRVHPPYQVPSDWRTLSSRPDGFSLRFPPDWGDRDEKTGEFLDLDERCGEDDRTPSVSFSVYACSLQPMAAPHAFPEFGFMLNVTVVRLQRGETAEQYASDHYGRISADQAYFESASFDSESFSGRTWYIVERREAFPPAGTDPCSDFKGGPGQCVRRTYYADLRGRTIIELELFGHTPELFEEFLPTAERIVHSVVFSE